MLSRQERERLATIETHLEAEAPELATQLAHLRRPVERWWARRLPVVLAGIAVFLLGGVVGALVSAYAGAIVLLVLVLTGGGALLFRAWMRGREPDG